MSDTTDQADIGTVPVRLRSRLMSGKFLLIGSALAAALGFLLWTATQGAAVYYHTVGELIEMGSQAEGRLVRVNGTIVDHSIHPRDADGSMRFQIEDDTGMLSVEFRGSPPNLFGYADEDKYADVIAEGRLLKSGVFAARNLIVKHGPDFEPREIPSQ